VYSSPNHGSTFQIFWPGCAPDTSHDSDDAMNAKLKQSSGEKIVLVEDDIGVRSLTKMILTRAGYDVMVLENPLDALNWLEHLQEAPDLLITDVVMPGMNGRDMANRWRQRFPNLPVIYVSGYTQTEILRYGLAEEIVSLLPKPYTMQQLISQVRAVLRSSDKVEPSA
jgi:two-component system, cell cycle sensor histidine kinase and response regulator CckA